MQKPFKMEANAPKFNEKSIGVAFNNIGNDIIETITLQNAVKIVDVFGVSNFADFL